jgi:hypothetical protein
MSKKDEAINKFRSLVDLIFNQEVQPEQTDNAAEQTAEVQEELPVEESVEQQTEVVNEQPESTEVVETVALAFQQQEQTDPFAIFNVQALQEKINLGVNGIHTIEFEVMDGSIVWGAVYSQSYQQLKSQVEKEIKSKFDSELDKLSNLSTDVNLKKVIVSNTEDKPTTRKEIIMARMANKDNQIF